jgi:hypothetical protein
MLQLGRCEQSTGIGSGGSLHSQTSHPLLFLLKPCSQNFLQRIGLHSGCCVTGSAAGKVEGASAQWQMSQPLASLTNPYSQYIRQIGGHCDAAGKGFGTTAEACPSLHLRSHC